MFGSTVVANDLHIATAYRRSHGLNVITLDGDKADRKGALTGGYHDVRRSRIEGIRAEKNWRAKLESDSARLAEVKQAITKLEQDVTRVIGKIQVLDSKRKTVQQGREPLAAEIQYAEMEMDQLKTKIARLEKSLDDATTDVTTLGAKKAAFEAELKTKMLKGLTSQEETQVNDLSKQVDQLQTSLSEKAKDRGEVSAVSRLFCCR